MNLQYGEVYSVNDPRLKNIMEHELLKYYKNNSGTRYNIFTDWKGNYGPPGSRFKVMGDKVKFSPPQSVTRNWQVRGGPSRRRNRKSRKVNRKTRTTRKH
jgi:hypothetical protein